MEKKINLKSIIILSILIFVVDRITKQVFISNGEHVINNGFSLGILSNTNIIASIVVLIMLSFIAIIIFKLKDSYQIRNLLIIVFVAGCSNLLDRFVYGGVIDFIHLPFIPTFNIADATITITTILLIFVYIKDGRKENTQSK